MWSSTCNAADQHGLRIRHIFETHLHADFVSGHKELASRTGAQIYIGHQAGVTFLRLQTRMDSTSNLAGANLHFPKRRDIGVRASVSIAVHCKSGYRSTIACSLLMRAGYGDVSDVLERFDAWEAALPSVKAEAASSP